MIRNRTYTKANISYDESGIVIDTTHSTLSQRHYNVNVVKIDDMFKVTAERPEADCFFHEEYDPLVVNEIIDEHVNVTRPFLGAFGGGKRYVHGWCEKKKREQITILSNNITIIE